MPDFTQAWDFYLLKRGNRVLSLGRGPGLRPGVFKAREIGSLGSEPPLLPGEGVQRGSVAPRQRGSGRAAVAWLRCAVSLARRFAGPGRGQRKDFYALSLSVRFNPSRRATAIEYSLP